MRYASTIAAKPRKRTAVASPRAPAACTPRAPPRTTIAIFTYHSGRGAARHDGEQEEIGEGEARDPRERRVGLRDRRERLRGREPHLRRHAPAEEVRAGEGTEREGEHEEADPEGPPVFARLHDRHPPL